jgi:hypothetical protein
MHVVIIGQDTPNSCSQTTGFLHFSEKDKLLRLAGRDVN